MTALQWTHYVKDYNAAEGWESGDGDCWAACICGDGWQLLRQGALDYGTWPTAASARQAAQVWEDAQ